VDVSDDDPVEDFVEETFDGEDDGVSIPQTRDMEAELRDRTGVSAGGDDEEMASVDSEVATPFWAAVVYVNAGVFLVALGPTVYAIRGYPLVSATLSGVGVLALLRAYWVYRRFEARDGDADDGTELSEADSSEGAVEDVAGTDER
jgi:hypothetical protein